MADLILHGLDNPLRWKVEEFANALPWVNRGGILSRSDSTRTFNVHAVEGFVKYLQLTAIPCNQRTDCRRLSTGIMRKLALEYQQRSKSLHQYRCYNGTTGEFILAAYMTGFIPLVTNSLYSTDNRDYIAYFDKTPSVFYEMRSKQRSRWWQVSEFVGRTEIPTLCLTTEKAINVQEALTTAGGILGRRVFSAHKIVPEYYLP